MGQAFSTQECPHYGKNACVTLALIVAMLVPSACKRTKREAPVKQAVQSGGVSSMIHVADPSAQLQLTKGFYQVEGNSWRWTADSFSAALRPPRDASEKGAKLVLKFLIPDAEIQQLKSLRLSATVNGIELPPEEYRKAGAYTYSHDVPPAALRAEAVNADFKLDKFLPPGPHEPRALGIVVSAIGFEAN